MKKIKIKPCEGFRVKKPDGAFLSDGGEEVVSGTYWHRRIKFGEVELVGEVKEAPKEKVEKSEEPKEEKKEIKIRRKSKKGGK